jgi:uroporphyrin-III C-methyltransferase
MRSLALAPVAPVAVASSSASASASARRGAPSARSARPTLPQSRRLAALGNRAARRGSSRRLAASASDESASPYYSEGAAGPEDVDSLLELYLSKASSRSAADKRGPTPPVSDAGKVYLVGTGPGDPGLLTLKAFHLMQTADVVLYDRLVSPAILDLVHDGAHMLYVGKQAGFHTRTQDEIERMLLGFAEKGASVVRLKGGDPLVFGRGGEEMETLMNRGFKVTIVPGITAAAGVGSELGIPLTHRGAATSVRLLTGHLREGAAREAAEGTGNAVVDPVAFAVTSADVDTTLVVYMGLQTLPLLAEKLIASGFPEDMPAVAVERGTTKHERRVFGTVAALPDAVLERGLKSPTLIIVGNTVKLSPWWPWRDALGEPASPKRSVAGGSAHAHGFQDGPAGEDTEAWFTKNARTVRRLRALSEAEAEEEARKAADVSGKGEPVAS